MIFWVACNWRLQRCFLTLPELLLTDRRFSKVWASTGAGNKFLLIPLINLFLCLCWPHVSFLLYFSLLSLCRRDFFFLHLEGLPLKWAHQCSPRWFKTCTTHAYSFIHAHSFFFWKNLHFVLILHIISRVQLLCESWQHGNYCHWSTNTTCSSIHSFPFLHWVLSSCVIGKLRLLKSDNIFSLGITPLLPGDYYYACKT